MGNGRFLRDYPASKAYDALSLYSDWLLSVPPRSWSQISPAVASRRIKVFRAYSQFEVTIIRMVEKAGINKALAAIPYLQGDTIRDMMQLCIETPYYSLRAALQEAYPQSDGHRRRNSRSKACLSG